MFHMMNMMLKIDFGKRVKSLRQKKNLSQEEFAFRIGMDRSYLASVELGKRNISLENIYKISKGLEISLSEFFKGIGG